MVGVDAHEGLQQRRGQLHAQGDQSDLPEIQAIRLLQDRIHRRSHRLPQVVQEVAKADGRQNPERRCTRSANGRNSGRRADTRLARHCW